MVNNRKENIRGDFVNEVTEYLDTHLKADTTYFKNYIYHSPINRNWIIRVPGMSTGGIQVENGIIQRIELNKDSIDWYDDTVLEGLDKFIGKKFKFID